MQPKRNTATSRQSTTGELKTAPRGVGSLPHATFTTGKFNKARIVTLTAGVGPHGRPSHVTPSRGRVDFARRHRQLLLVALTLPSSMMQHLEPRNEIFARNQAHRRGHLICCHCLSSLTAAFPYSFGDLAAAARERRSICVHCAGHSRTQFSRITGSPKGLGSPSTELPWTRRTRGLRSGTRSEIITRWIRAGALEDHVLRCEKATSLATGSIWRMPSRTLTNAALWWI